MRIYLSLILCAALAGCLPPAPPTPAPPAPPVTPVNPDNTPIQPDAVVEMEKPSNDYGLGTSLPPAFAAYRDPAVAKHDAYVLFRLYKRMAEKVELDGATGKKLKTLAQFSVLYGESKEFDLQGTDFNSIIRRYPAVPPLTSKALAENLPSGEISTSLEFTDELRAKAVAVLRAMAWGCYQASKP